MAHSEYNIEIIYKIWSFWEENSYSYKQCHEVQKIEWEECFVCDGKENGDLRSTTKGIVTLAG